MVCLDPRATAPSRCPRSLMAFLRVSPLFPLHVRKEESARSLLNDKREVQAQRQRYEQYSVVVEEVGGAGEGKGRGGRGVGVPGRQPGPRGPTLRLSQVLLQPGEGSPYRGDDYEDEYDDTYDGNQVGANDADSDDELISRR